MTPDPMELMDQFITAVAVLAFCIGVIVGASIVAVSILRSR
jgi:hypothetical protein